MLSGYPYLVQRFLEVPAEALRALHHALRLIALYELAECMGLKHLHDDLKSCHAVPVSRNRPYVIGAELFHDLHVREHVRDPGFEHDVEVEHLNIVSVYQKFLRVDCGYAGPEFIDAAFDGSTDFRNGLDHLEGAPYLLDILDFT